MHIKQALIFALTVLVLLNAQAEEEAQGFADVSVKYLEPSTTGKYKLPLTLIVDRNSSWKEEQIVTLVRDSEQIFKQCDIQYSTIKMMWVTHPDLAEFSPSNDYIIARHIPKEDRPAIVFNMGTNGYVYANPEYYKDHDHEDISRDTIFIDKMAYGMLAGEKLKNFKGVIAHELMHILLNEAHNNIPKNILTNRTPLGFEISQDQCQKALQKVPGT